MGRGYDCAKITQRNTALIRHFPLRKCVKPFGPV